MEIENKDDVKDLINLHDKSEITQNDSWDVIRAFF